VSVALIYRYFDPHGAAALDGHRSTLITTTLLLVLFSTMALGGLTKPMLDYIQGPAGEGISCYIAPMFRVLSAASQGLADVSAADSILRDRHNISSGWQPLGKRGVAD
jgi:hypothetical protein